MEKTLTNPPESAAAGSSAPGHAEPCPACPAPARTEPVRTEPGRSLPENSLYVFLTFALVGGFLEAYTYLLHGGVFCNAQTGNLVLFVLRLVQGRFAEAWHYLFSILAYLAGILVSAALPLLLKKLRLPLLTTAVEMCAFAALAFIPQGASDWYTYVSVSFLCALQYNTFTECRGAKAATTFCTNNLRQAAVNLFGGVREKDKAKLKKSGVYALVILCFALGAVAGGLTAEHLGNYSVLLCTAVLLPVFLFLLVRTVQEGRADTDTKK